MTSFQYTIDMAVRDYECDFQGIVNNAVYLNYLEHARHEFAKDVGLDVVTLAQKGINLVLIRAELDYKSPLRSGDTFMIGLNVKRISRMKIVFDQEIRRHEKANHEGRRKDAEDAGVFKNLFDPDLVLKARMTSAAMDDKGKPILPTELDRLFEDV